MNQVAINANVPREVRVTPTYPVVLASDRMNAPKMKIALVSWHVSTVSAPILVHLSLVERMQIASPKITQPGAVARVASLKTPMASACPNVTGSSVVTTLSASSLSMVQLVSVWKECLEMPIQEVVVHPLDVHHLLLVNSQAIFVIKETA